MDRFLCKSPRSPLLGCMIRVVTFLLSVFITSNLLLFYAFDEVWYLGILVGLSILYLMVRPSNALIITVSLCLATLLGAILIDKTGLDQTTLFSPYAKYSYYDYSMGHGRFRKNIKIVMDMPFGDLKARAVDPDTPSISRRVEFVTDSLGFRNRLGYHGQEYVLLGDSFVAGNGSTQDVSLNNQLESYEISGYNLGYPGGVEDYVRYLDTLEAGYHNTSKVLLFLFEGNDFPQSGFVKLSPPRGQKISLHERIGNTFFYRFMRTAMERKKWLAKPEAERLSKVSSLTINGTPMSYMIEYAQVCVRDKPYGNPVVESALWSLRDRVSHIFFIPAKYRVYHALGAKQTNPSLPNRQWEFTKRMGEKMGIGTTNLTPTLVEESQRLLADRTFTYWVDDTHWNKYGMAVAARVIAIQRP